MSIITSSEVAAGDAALASAYNALRDDIITAGGDYATAGGAANAFTLSLDATITSYTTGAVYMFKANHATTGSVTLDINSIGAKTLKKANDQNLESGDIENGQVVGVVYDGTNLQMFTPCATQMSSANSDTLTDGSNADALHVHATPKGFHAEAVAPTMPTAGNYTENTITTGFTTKYTLLFGYAAMDNAADSDAEKRFGLSVFDGTTCLGFWHILAGDDGIFDSAINSSIYDGIWARSTSGDASALNVEVQSVTSTTVVIRTTNTVTAGSGSTNGDDAKVVAICLRDYTA